MELVIRRALGDEVKVYKNDRGDISIRIAVKGKEETGLVLREEEIKLINNM